MLQWESVVGRGSHTSLLQALRYAVPWAVVLGLLRFNRGRDCSLYNE